MNPKKQKSVGRVRSQTYSPIAKTRTKRTKRVLPNGIKKPASAYMLFNKKRMKSVMESHPGKCVGDVAKLVANEWKGLTDAQKKPYFDEHAVSKKLYEQKLQEIGLKFKGQSTLNPNKNLDSRKISSK